MVGSVEDPQTYGIIPCAISWLFKGIQEQKSRTGARFSVRVSAVEVSGPAAPIKDLLAGQSNGNYYYATVSRVCHFVHKDRFEKSCITDNIGIPYIYTYIYKRPQNGTNKLFWPMAVRASVGIYV